MRRLTGICLALLLAGCRSEAPRPEPQPTVIWKPVGAWSGHGDKQTETFTSDTGDYNWELLDEDGPVALPLWRAIYQPFNKKLKGFIPHPTDYYFAEEWYYEDA